MSNRDMVREALAGGSMTKAELIDKTGLDAKVLDQTLGAMGGEIARMGRGDQASIALKGAPRGGATPKSARNRVKRTKKARAQRPFKRIADRVAEAPRPNGNVALARHVGTTFAALESVIETDQLEPHLAIALRSHKEAIELLAAHG